MFPLLSKATKLVQRSLHAMLLHCRLSSDISQVEPLDVQMGPSLEAAYILVPSQLMAYESPAMDVLLNELPALDDIHVPFVEPTNTLVPSQLVTTLVHVSEEESW